MKHIEVFKTCSWYDAEKFYNFYRTAFPKRQLRREGVNRMRTAVYLITDNPNDDINKILQLWDSFRSYDGDVSKLKNNWVD